MCTATIRSQKLGGGLNDALKGRAVIIVVMAVRQRWSSSGDRLRISLRTREPVVELPHVNRAASDVAWRAVKKGRRFCFRVSWSARCLTAAGVEEAAWTDEGMISKTRTRRKREFRKESGEVRNRRGKGLSDIDSRACIFAREC